MEFRVPNGTNGDAPTMDEIQIDMVIRGLRRRLWRAFQQDDAGAALRCYQATFDDYEQMLQEEEEGKERVESGDESRSKSPISVSLLNDRSIRLQGWMHHLLICNKQKI